MDIQNDSASDGATMNIWGCTGATSQQFKPIPQADGSYQLQSMLSGKCLDLAGDVVANGTPAALWACNPAIPTQHWYFDFDPSYSRGWQLKSGANTGYCLDLFQESTAAGTAVHLWQCSPLLSQAWLVANTSTPFAQADGSGTLQTWWHDNYEWNTSSPVADGNVRRSSYYGVRVSDPQAPLLKYDAFSYMSIPRGGRQKWLYTTDDGAETATANQMTMSWTSFLYRSGAWVDVQFFDQTIRSAADVVIQPQSLNLKVVMLDSRTVSIYVPYRSQGYRFSVEHRNEMITVDAGQQVPRNALMIFAEPFPAPGDGTVPSTSDAYFPSPGQVTGLENVTNRVIYFQPGVYYMPWNYWAVLRPGVHQVYLAPGAYVKGAFEMNPGGGPYAVTGYGVISGEKYVYMADTKPADPGSLPFAYNGNAVNCLFNCVKLLRMNLSGNTSSSLAITGVTLSDSPYWSYDNGGPTTFPMTVNRYKQVGSWYWQTNGIQLNSNSVMNDSFIHANDDTINVYGSNVTYEDTVVWKGENGPVIQFGWSAQNANNALVDNVEVIHNQMDWSTADNMCIINSAPPIYGGFVSSGMTFKNVTFHNIHVNGQVPCLIRIDAVENLNNVLIRNLAVDQWTASPFMNTFAALDDSSGNPVSTGGYLGGLKIENYSVGGQVRSRSGMAPGPRASWGTLDFDASLWNTWNCWVDPSQL